MRKKEESAGPTPGQPLKTAEITDWYVLYCKSRAEKKCAEKLLAMGFEVFCPVRKTRRRWSDRWKWVEEPLFNSYIFLRIEDHRREEVFVVPGLVRYLFWLGKPARVRDSEIQVLRTWLGEYAHEAISMCFVAEERVRIRSGVLMDAEAKVVMKKGNKLKLFLEGLRAEVTVDLQQNQVEKIDASKPH